MSPFLFSVFSAYCKPSHDDNVIYADDTVLTGLITNDDEQAYLQEIKDFVDWCDKNYLELNVTKTKEMIIDFRKNINNPKNPVIIKGKAVDIVGTFKYLGIILDNTISWVQNTDNIVKKTKQRLYCLRKLRSFDVNKILLQNSISLQWVVFCLSVYQVGEGI